MTTLTIKLAGREFTISKLTLRQLRDSVRRSRDAHCG